MSDLNNARLISSNFVWRLLERCGAQGVTFVVSIILARLLDPKAYGIVALVTVFTTIMQVFVDSGLGNALIQKKDSDDVDFSSVFYFNILVCIIIYCVMYFMAPTISRFYKMEELTPIIRVMSLTIVISGVKNIQQAYVSKHMLFKKFFYATVVGTIGAAVIGIVLAYLGYGVWALVLQNIFNVFVDTMMLWILVKWRPKLVFSIDRLKKLINYGYKILFSTLLDTIYNDLRQLVIGKIYSSDSLAYYNRGQQYSSVFVSNINVSMDSILLPVLSSKQDNEIELRNYTKQAIKISTYVMMPLMMGLAVCAEPIVELTLTSKWIDTVFFLRVFCFNYAFYPMHTANLNAIKASGRSDIILKIEIIKKIVGFAALFSTMFISIKALALSMVITTIFNVIINAYPNKKIINYGVKNQIIDVLPNIVICVGMGVITYSLGFLSVHMLVKLLIQIIAGISVYIVFSIFSKNDSYYRLVSIINGFKHNRKCL